ncbi:unnamed protein product [Ixodes hexagonus]
MAAWLAFLLCFVVLCISVCVLVGVVLGALHVARLPTWKHLKNMPGPNEDIPLLWVVLQHLRALRRKPLVPYNVSTLEIRVAHFKEFESSGLFRFYIGTQPTVVVFRADYIEAVLTNTLSKSIDYSLLHSWLGTGLLTSSGSKWKARRRMLTPAFHFRILDDFVSAINEHTRHMVKKIRQLSEQDEWIDVVPLAASTTLDVLLETIMGITTGQQLRECQSYVKAANFLADQMVFRAQTPWLLVDFIFYRTEYGRRYKEAVDHAHKFSAQVIQNRRKELIKERMATSADGEANPLKKKRLLTFLDILLTYSLDSDSSFTDEDIREEVDTFMFEGHDTTALAIAWALYLIALYPEVQKKLQQELDTVLGDDPEKDVSMDDMKELKYMDRVTKECQRLYPSVPFIGRTVTKELKLGDFVLPEDTTIDIFIYALHRDPKIFPDSEVFDPERFSSENSASRHPFAFIPFSAGSRNCIGKKNKAYVCR